MITISKDLLLENGYKTYENNFLDKNYYCNSYQKRFKDERGNTKYFINIDESLGFNKPGSVYDESDHNWWPSLNIDMPSLDGENERHLKIELIQWFNNSGQFSKISIEEMEYFAEFIFHALDSKTYDTVWSWTDKEKMKNCTDFLDRFYLKRAELGDLHYIKKLSFSFVCETMKTNGYTGKDLMNYNDLLSAGIYDLCLSILLCKDIETDEIKF